MKKKLQTWLWLFLLPVPLLWIAADQVGWLAKMENATVDWRFQRRGAIDSKAKVSYVDIDTEAMQGLGNFPWSHEVFATVCRALIEQGGAKVVGIDIVMSETGIPQIADMDLWNAGHREFGRYLWSGAPVVLAASYSSVNLQTETKDGGLPLQPNMPPERPEWKTPATVLYPPHMGLIDAYKGGTRSVPIFVPQPDGSNFYHMAVELARLYLGQGNDSVTVSDHALTLTAKNGEALVQAPMRRGQLVDINWFSPWLDDQHNPRVSLLDVFIQASNLQSDDETERTAAQVFFNSGRFRDSIVLIGPVDPLLQDLAPTSFDDQPVPKVGVHGNLVKTLLNNRFIKYPDNSIRYLITLGLAVLVSFLAMVGARLPVNGRLIGLALVLGYMVLGFELFSRSDWVLPMVAPMGAALSASFIGIAAQLIIEEKQKGRIKGLFGTYVAPALVERMVDSGEEPKLGGVEEEITAYFSDIQSFSSFSEKLSPPKLVELMNEYLTACTDILQAEGGTLDKYIGDAVVGMYGAPLLLPDHAHRACVAALRIRERELELREKWRAEIDKWPDVVHHLRTRIGLNTGKAVVGNMGSHSRFNYTMMGDTVNLAARMESGAKTYGVYTMVTDVVVDTARAQGGSHLVFRHLDKIRVKGRTQPVDIFELLAFEEKLSATTRRCLENYAKGVNAYFSQEWQTAAEHFALSARDEPLQPGRDVGISTNPSLLLQERCLLLALHPPGKDWDGVYTMTSK